MFSIERHLEQPLLLRRRNVLDDDRDPGELGLLRGAPATFARDDLVSLAAAHRAVEPADDDRLNDAVRLDRSRELIELAGVDRSARLIVIGLELIDVDFERRARRRRQRIRRIGNERAQSLSECWSFFHGLFLLLACSPVRLLACLTRAQARFFPAPRERRQSTLQRRAIAHRRSRQAGRGLALRRGARCVESPCDTPCP